MSWMIWWPCQNTSKNLHDQVCSMSGWSSWSTPWCCSGAGVRHCFVCSLRCAASFETAGMCLSVFLSLASLTSILKQVCMHLVIDFMALTNYVHASDYDIFTTVLSWMPKWKGHLEANSLNLLHCIWSPLATSDQSFSVMELMHCFVCVLMKMNTGKMKSLPQIVANCFVASVDYSWRKRMQACYRLLVVTQVCIWSRWGCSQRLNLFWARSPKTNSSYVILKWNLRRSS